MEEFNHPYDTAREDMKSDWYVKIELDLTVGFIVAIVTSIEIHMIFGPTSLFIRKCCFAIFCSRELYHLINGIVIKPFFTARFFTTEMESKAFFRAAFLLAGYVGTLLAIRLMFVTSWVFGAIWGKLTWTMVVSTITAVGGLVVFGGKGLSYLNKVGPYLLAWMVSAYYRSKITSDIIGHWISDTQICSLALWTVQVLIRCCLRFPNPTSLPVFKFPTPGFSDSDLEDLSLVLCKGQFRLLHIRRRVPFLEVHADLQPYTFGENPKYDSISYCWGQRQLEHSAECSEKPKHRVSADEEGKNCCAFQPIKENMHLIVLNGRQHYVPTNVHDILRRRSSFLRPSCIWIDSICIDQLNLDEKNHQVPMMRSIYERASHVYVCLGEDKSAWLAMSMVNELIFVFLISTPENFSAYISDLYLRRLSGKDSALNDRVEAFYQLLCNKWFTRVWVFQEVAFASAVTVLYGNWRMIWEYFGTLELIFSDPRFHELAGVFTYSGEAFIDRRFKGLHQFIVMDQMRRKRKDLGIFFRGIPLVDILRRTSILQATVQVDKIFAVLACAEGFEHELKSFIDYTVPLKTTLLRVANHTLRNGQLFQSLPYAGIGWMEVEATANIEPKDGIPSWVVDWSVPRSETGTVAGSPQRGTPYRAGTSRRAKISAHELTDEANEELVMKIKIRGQVLDKIQHTTSVCNFNHESEESSSILSSLPRQVEWFQEVEDFIASHCSSMTQTEQQEMMWRVLVGDRGSKTRPAPHSYGEHFQTMRNTLLGLQAVVDDYGTEDLPRLMQAIHDHGPFEGVSTKEDLGDVARDMIRGDALYESAAFPRRMAITQEKGCLGMVPKGTTDGDLVVLFWGAEVPFVLREGPVVDGVIEYEIVGECYVHGVMDGEGVIGNGEEQDFIIL